MLWLLMVKVWIAWLQQHDGLISVEMREFDDKLAAELLRLSVDVDSATLDTNLSDIAVCESQLRGAREALAAELVGPPSSAAASSTSKAGGSSSDAQPRSRLQSQLDEWVAAHNELRRWRWVRIHVMLQALTQSNSSSHTDIIKVSPKCHMVIEMRAW